MRMFIFNSHQKTPPIDHIHLLIMTIKKQLLVT